MGKEGPCCHCGIDTTPLWRNGPPEKPVLCNACGSRWRTKGTLVNYMPIHAGGLGLKKSSSTKKMEHHSKKRKDLSTSGFWTSHNRVGHNGNSFHEEDDCNTSSTGSGMSFAESCVPHIATTSQASEFWPPWVSPIPSKQRSMMHRQRPSAKNAYIFSLPKPDHFLSKGSAEEDLLVDCHLPSMTTEIGLGGILIKPHAPKLVAPESEASSFRCKTKEESDITREGTPGVRLSEGSSKHRGKERTKPCARKSKAPGNGSLKGWMPNKALLENFPYNKRDVLQSCHSPLVFLELKDITNADTFTGLLSDQEQVQLMKFLSQADLQPDSLRCVFSSAQFESALRGFQDLLSAGMFDAQESGVSPRVLQHYQQLLMITDLTASGWTERCSQFGKRRGSSDFAKIMQGKEYLKAKLNSLNTSWDLLSSSIPAFKGTSTEVGETPEGSTVRMQSQAPTPISAGRFRKGGKPVESCSRQRRGAAKQQGIEGEGSRRPPPGSVNLHSYSQGGGKIPAPLAYGVLEQQQEEELLLLDFPSTVSFQQAELLQQLPWGAKNQASQGSKTQEEEEPWHCEFLRNSPSAGSVNDTTFL